MLIERRVGFTCLLCFVKVAVNGGREGYRYIRLSMSIMHIYMELLYMQIMVFTLFPHRLLHDTDVKSPVVVIHIRDVVLCTSSHRATHSPHLYPLSI